MSGWGCSPVRRRIELPLVCMVGDVGFWTSRTGKSQEERVGDKRGGVEVVGEEMNRQATVMEREGEV